MESILDRFFGNLVGRLHGPLTFRLVLQPTMAALLALRAGLRDAREGRPAYLWALVTRPGDRARLLKEGWKSAASVFVVAALIDIVYQLMMFGWVYPLEAVTVAALLAFVPYLVLRGPVNRVASALRRGRPGVR